MFFSRLIKIDFPKMGWLTENADDDKRKTKERRRFSGLCTALLAIEVHRDPVRTHYREVADATATKERKSTEINTRVRTNARDKKPLLRGSISGNVRRKRYPLILER